ncbi:MAG: hypothetical protein Q9226_002837 [Calogaya cf. arnoldii]
MGTSGLKVWRYRKRYFPCYNGHDSYPSGLGWWIAKSIPTDPKEYQQWLEKHRRMIEAWDRRYEQFLSVPADVEQKYRELVSEPEDDTWADEEWELPNFAEGNWLPNFMAPFKEVAEYVYTINLEQEVLSINNEIHYRLANLPVKEDWFKTNLGGLSALPTDNMMNLATVHAGSGNALSKVDVNAPSLLTSICDKLAATNADQSLLPPCKLVHPKSICKTP